jgi:hypothetical protein
MQKYVASKYEIKHGVHSVVVASDVDLCCYIHITGAQDLDNGHKCSIPFMGVGMLRTYPDNMSWCWRIKSAWKLLRGSLWAGELEFWSHDDADRFITAFKETADLVFKEE